MRLVICIKPVIDNYTTQMLSAGEKRYAVNPYDQEMLKQLFALKREQDFELIVLCMGSMKCREILFRLFACGADRIILLSDLVFAGADTYVTSEVLSRALLKIGNVDYVFCGAKAIDGETGQVPYELAHRLNMQVISEVSKIMSVKEDGLQLLREWDSLMQEEKITLPSVIIGKHFTTEEFTVSLLSLKKAKGKEITIYDHNILGLSPKQCGIAGSRTKVMNAREINRYRKGEVLEGELEQVSQKILKLMIG